MGREHMRRCIPEDLIVGSSDSASEKEGNEITKGKEKAPVPILVNSVKFNVEQTHQDNLFLRSKLDACKKDKHEIAKQQKKVAKRDDRLAQQADKIEELQAVIARQAQEIEKLKKKPSQENCNEYPCKNAYRGCEKITHNTHNKEVHEKYCKFNEVDKDGNPKPLNDNQKKKEQKKRAAERRKQAASPYQRPATAVSSANAQSGRPTVLQAVDPSNISRRK